MKQQINLYQPMFRRQKKVFSAMTMLQICLFFIFVFSATYGFELYRINPFQKQVAQLDKNLAELNAQMVKLASQQSSKAKSQLLESEVARLANELVELKRIQGILSTHEFGNDTGFSSYLEALARQHVDGTWLTKVSITGGGAALGLEGKTLSSELVPIYIQQLAEEQTLAGSSFNVMELHRLADEEAHQLVFKISTN